MPRPTATSDLYRNNIMLNLPVYCSSYIFAKLLNRRRRSVLDIKHFGVKIWKRNLLGLFFYGKYKKNTYLDNLIIIKKLKHRQKPRHVTKELDFIKVFGSVKPRF